MIESTTLPGLPPNPSVLIALHFAQNHSQDTEQKLLKRLGQDAVDKVKTGQDFSSGKVALYALAFQASCSNPRKVSGTLDLVELLEKKFEMELKNIKIHDSPLTSHYQLSLCVLTLCQLQGTFSPSEIADLFRPDEKKYSLGGSFSVDTAAVAVLAQICVQTTDTAALSPEVNQTIAATVQWLLKKILEKKSQDGVIGNIYSTGLAMQALTVSDNYLTPGSWNCSQTLARVLREIPEGTFDNSMAASQIVPSLEGQTYLDVSTINCSQDENDLTLSTSLPTTPSSTPPDLITVNYTVTDGVNNTFSDSIKISVPKGSVFLRVMEAAQKDEPYKFSFIYEQQSWGVYITSVRGLNADLTKHTYWELLSGGKALPQGAGDYVVKDGESLMVKFTTY
ncbi:transcobalamin-1-like isoform X2 [Elgaria multicarinata webbii]